MGKLFCNSESQKQDAAIRRIGTNEITNRNMETMEEAKDQEETLNKIRYPKTKGL